MSTGAITESIDVAQITLYVFWIFFAGLVYYLHRENKREGYPLESEGPTRGRIEGFPRVPDSKVYRLRDGSTISAPRAALPAAALNGVPHGAYPGAPLNPTGNPMLDGIGPGAYAMRADVPDQTFEGTLRIVPLRSVTDFGVAGRDVDPRGLPVIGADHRVGGTVRDLWVDRAEMLFRYLEVETPGGARVLLPINFARIGARGVKVRSVMGRHFAEVPRTRQPDQVTFLEEERIMAFYGAGTLYADPARAEPLL